MPNRPHRSASTFQCPFCDELPDLTGHDNHSKMLSRHISEHCFKNKNGNLMSKATKNETNLKKLQKKIGKVSRTEAIGIIVQLRKLGDDSLVPLRQLGDDSLVPTKGEFSSCYSYFFWKPNF